MKTYLLALLPLLLLTACLPQLDLNQLQPVQDYLKEHPSADIKVILWDEQATSLNMDLIQKTCDQKLPIKSYWYVAITEEGSSLKMWVDQATNQIVCAVRKGAPAKSAPEEVVDVKSEPQESPQKPIEVVEPIPTDDKKTNPPGNEPEPVTGQSPNDPVTVVEISADDDPYLGNKDAPVTIIEFSDYQCPFCGIFATQTLPQIKSKYIDSGKVKFVYRDFPLEFHAEAKSAANAANCAAEQGKYFEYHDQIFHNQAQLGKDNYKLWAQELGLDVGQWVDCFLTNKFQDEIEHDIKEGKAANVQGTPTFFINGEMMVGAQPYSEFEKAIENKLN